MEETLKQILSEIKDLKKGISDLKQDTIALKEGTMALKEDTIALKQDTIALKQDTIALKQDTIALKEGTMALKQDTTALKQDTIALKEGQDRIGTKVDNLLSELRSNFKYTNDKLDDHRKVFEVVSDEIKGVKVDIEYLSSKTGKHDTELNNIINKLRG